MSWIPAAVILFLVDLLFAAFVVVQFTYFFGAHTNITAEGYTYAEYARRGFFELVSVAVLSLVLVFGLGAITQRKIRSQQIVLTALNLVLICLVLVMLLSSWQRLNLYEEAYGFSRLRTYTTVFIPWLGALLVAVGVMDLLGKMRWFALSLLIATVGFVFSLPVLNIDSFIANRNIDRAVYGEEFDAAYLASLWQMRFQPCFPDITLPTWNRSIKPNLAHPWHVCPEDSCQRRNNPGNLIIFRIQLRALSLLLTGRCLKNTRFARKMFVAGGCRRYTSFLQLRFR